MHRIGQLVVHQCSRQEHAAVARGQELLNIRVVLHAGIVGPASFQGQREGRGVLPAIHRIAHHEAIHVVQHCLLVLGRLCVHHEVEAIGGGIALARLQARPLHRTIIALRRHLRIDRLDRGDRQRMTEEHRGAFLQPVHLWQRICGDAVRGILRAILPGDGGADGHGLHPRCVVHRAFPAGVEPGTAAFQQDRIELDHRPLRRVHREFEALAHESIAVLDGQALRHLAELGPRSAAHPCPDRGRLP